MSRAFELDLVQIAQTSAQCEICEKVREGIGAIAVRKTLPGHGQALTDFVICDVCVDRLFILAVKRHRGHTDNLERSPPPPPQSAGGGGS